MKKSIAITLAVIMVLAALHVGYKALHQFDAQHYHFTAAEMQKANSVTPQDDAEFLTWDSDAK
jgi:hypothetical protein